MKPMLVFSKRCAREILRDPLTAFFGLGFPVVILLLLTAIQRSVPVPIFELSSLAPGIAVFGLSFLTLFSATLIARDRETAFLNRLFAAPLRAVDFILGYALPMLPIGILQTAFCYLTALLLGLEWTGRIGLCIALSLPMSVGFISLGLLCGSVLNVKQVGGLCGTLVTNLTAWLSGAWFDLKLVGGAFEAVGKALPFMHAVELQRACLCGRAFETGDLLWVAGYAVCLTCLSVRAFLRRMG